jgi:putative endonuclease
MTLIASSILDYWSIEMAQSPSKELGDRGEALVANWLQQKGCLIVAQQWHCRWGELDIIALSSEPSPCLAFVEVKTRRRGSLDQEGRLAVTAQKQRKLWRTAGQFLYKHPQYAECACRFDVAIVAQERAPQPPRLVLVEYLEDAFRVEE